jgi:hypothetical protein
MWCSSFIPILLSIGIYFNSRLEWRYQRSCDCDMIDLKISRVGKYEEKQAHLVDDCMV